MEHVLEGAGSTASPPQVQPARQRDEKPSILCNNLYRYSCAPGEFNDGTGIAYTDDVIKERVTELQQKTKDEFAAEFEKSLSDRKDPIKMRFREAALSAIGRAGMSPCKEEQDQPKDLVECDKVIAKGLTQLVQRRIFPAEGEGVSALGVLVSTQIPTTRQAVSQAQDLSILLENREFRRIAKRLTERARKKLTDEKSKERLEHELFPELKNRMASLADDLIEDPKERARAENKIRAMEFEGTECGDHFVSDEAKSSSVSSLLEPNAFYDPIANIFKYCNGFLLQNQSIFQMVYVMAHEMGHALDPCDIARGPSDFVFHYKDPKNVKACEEEYPLKGLLGCIRGEDSMMARRLVIEAPAPRGRRPQEDPNENKVPNDGEKEDVLVPGPPARRARFVKKKIEAPDLRDSPFCGTADQVGEGVSDWIANEILPGYIQDHYLNSKPPKLSHEQVEIGYSNALRGLCNNVEPKGSDPRDTHPDMERRINFGVNVQPVARAQRNCPKELPPGAKYCEVKKRKKEHA
jgi:hypothetical protein